MTPVLFSVTYAGFWGQHRLGVIPFLEKARALGYPAVELVGKRPHVSPLDHPDAEHLAAIRSAAERLGIEIATVADYNDFTAGRHAPEVPFGEIQLLYVRELCRCARELGASLVRVFSGYYTDLSDHHADWVRCVTALREAAELAADYGVTLGLQNHHDVGLAVGAFADLLDDVDHPHLKAMFDPWSIGLHGADLYTAAKRMAPRMVQTTLADYVRWERYQYQPALINYRTIEPPAVRAVPLGQGCLDLTGFFQGLRDGGFDGYVAYEICSPIRGGGSETNLDAASRHALQEIRRLWQSTHTCT
uniref:Sugar phosphate isomerase/epimerase n=1 Tax=Schlesneria paludicola TaxID=360056 RepID=A0A7C4LK45_9PLAN